MQQTMVLAAEAAEVARVGRSTVLPVHDVVDVQTAGGFAPGHPTGGVAVLDEAAGAVGDDVLRPADRHGDAVDPDDGHDVGVAEQVAAQRVGEHRAKVRLQAQRCIVRLVVLLAVEMPQHLVPIRVGSLGCALALGPFAHQQQGVDPLDLGAGFR